MRAEDRSLSDLAAWYFGAGERWPDVFTPADLSRYWSYAEGILRMEQAPDPQIRRAQLLRGALLKLIHAAAGQCEACPLHENRLAAGPVQTDGSLVSDPFAVWDGIEIPMGSASAEIMVIAEGPGNFEARTGTPLVSYDMLAGSHCARRCTGYEECYADKQKPPSRACEFVELETEVEQTIKRRANEKWQKLHTAGQHLDQALRSAGLWREAWNSKLAEMEILKPGVMPKPGSVFITNTVLCRPVDQLGKDRKPVAEEWNACNRFLEMHLYTLQPRVIVALGGLALHVLAGVSVDGILSRRGKLFQGLAGIPVVAEAHPSWAMHQGSAEAMAEYIKQLAAAFGVAKQIAAGSYVLPWEEKQPVVDPDDPFEGDFVEIKEDVQLPAPPVEVPAIVDKFGDITTAVFTSTFPPEQRAQLPG
jgi:uracil-DNA glycosylase family 4